MRVNITREDFDAFGADTKGSNFIVTPSDETDARAILAMGAQNPAIAFCFGFYLARFMYTKGRFKDGEVCSSTELN